MYKKAHLCSPECGTLCMQKMLHQKRSKIVGSAIKWSVYSIFVYQSAAFHLTFISKFPILVADRMMGRPTMAGKM